MPLQAIIQLTDRQPPTAFRIFQFGEISTRKGTFTLTPEGAERIIAAYQQHNVDVCIDYEHRALSDNAPPEQMKAAGWAKLEARPDGLWLTQVKWTPAAEAHLRAGEFRYFSPAFTADKDTHEITELINCAVTNLPASDGIEALVAASIRLVDGENVEPDDDEQARADLTLALEGDAIQLKIVKRGDKFHLYSEDSGRLLGKHPSRGAAERQERAINISKARKAGHKIPVKTSDVALVDRANIVAAAGRTDGLANRTSAEKVQVGVLQAAAASVTTVPKADNPARVQPKSQETNMTFRAILAQYAADHQELTVTGLCTVLGIDLPTLQKLAKGSPPSQEEMKKMRESASVAKCDIFQGESESAPIDASIQGGDVDKLPYKGDDAASAVFKHAAFDETKTDTDTDTDTATAAEMARKKKGGKGKPLFGLTDETPIAASGDEASETQGDKDIPGAIGMKLAQERTEKEIMTLTGAKTPDEARGVLLAWRNNDAAYRADHAKLEQLTRERDAAERQSLVDLGKKDGKLTPSLIEYFKGKPNAEFRAFLSVATPVINTRGGAVEPAPLGADGSPLLDFNADEAMVEQLIPSEDPKKLIQLRRELAVTLSAGTVIARTGDSPEYNRAIENAFRNPAEPSGWMPRTALRRGTV